jgi:hypothetical protein
VQHQPDCEFTDSVLAGVEVDELILFVWVEPDFVPIALVVRFNLYQLSFSLVDT